MNKGEAVFKSGQHNIDVYFDSMFILNHGGCNIHKWNKHFSEMKGDVGTSLHEKEGKKEDAYIETGSH